MGSFAAPPPSASCLSGRASSFAMWRSLLLGMILFFSPWLFSFSAGAAWQTTSPKIGLLVALLSMAALAAFAVWEEWLNLAAGVWLVVSPWLLGFQNSDAMTLHVVIGGIL